MHTDTIPVRERKGEGTVRFQRAAFAFLASVGKDVIAFGHDVSIAEHIGETNMTLTPVDILHKELRRSFRGYDVNEVDEFLRDISHEQERLISELTRLKEERHGLQKRLEQFERIEDTLQKTLVSAQQTAEETRLSAERRAEVIIAQAEQQRDSIIEDARRRVRDLELQAAQIRAQADQFEAELRALLKGHESLLNRIHEIGERSFANSKSQILEDARHALPIS